MKKGSSRSFRRAAPKKLKIAGIVTAALIVIFVCVTVYYFVSTPAATVLVVTADFPKDLSTNFTSDTLTNHVVANLQKILLQAEAEDLDEATRLEGLGPRPAKETIIPIRALSNSPSPVFDLEWRGINLNFCRRIGMSLRAKEYLELSVLGVPKTDGWRLTAFLKNWPHFSANPAGSAPQNGGACTDFENCATDLSEQILQVLDSRRLLNFYIKLKTPEGWRHVLELYPAIPQSSLEADDFVAWGNAFFGLKRFDEALQKYQEALEKDPKSCSAQVARGFVYYNRPHGMHLLSDLGKAEQDFRAAIACDGTNEYTRTSLCHTLLRKWVNSPKPEAQMLEEAKQQCEKALEINPQFVRASVNLAYVLYRQKRHEESLSLFENLSQRYPTHSALFLNYGFLEYLEYLESKKEETLKRAASHTLQAWNLDPHSDIAANNLGYFYYELGDYVQAVDFWNKAQALVPKDAECLAGLALGNYKLGKRKEALMFLSEAIRIDPHYRDPTYLIANNNWSNRAAKDLAKLIPLIRG